MSEPADISVITDWHAHVYYDPGSREQAARLRDWIGERFQARLGRWHDEKVGPHTQSMYQIAFGNAEFPGLVPFLALNRMGLTVLVHPETGNAVDDHLVHALWLGKVLEINAEALK